MILSLTERLEQEGGGSGWRPGGLAADLQPGVGAGGRSPYLSSRWFGSLAVPGVQGASTTSGRLASASTLVADRTDDGVLVAAPTAGSEQRIVWVGDLELDEPSGFDGAFLAPAFEFHRDGMGLDLEWQTVGREGNSAEADGEAAVTMRLTLPCRPVGELTFSNEDLDPEVWLCATRGGRMAARMRPYAALPELEIVPCAGVLEFERSPEWRLGLDVMDPDGTMRVEDRFSPGTFVLRIPEGHDRVRISIRIVAPNAAERGRRGGALGALLGQVRPARVASSADHSAASAAASSTESAPVAAPDLLRNTAMALPGEVLRRGLRSWEAEAELRDHLVQAAPHVTGARFDVALWAARAAFLVQPGVTRDVTSVTLPFMRGVVGRIERELEASGCPAGAAAGLPRWCSVSLTQERAGAETDTHSVAADEIPVEYAALLHQACQHAADLAGASDDAPLARRARLVARKLRRWFQTAFWLDRPERAADLAFIDGSPMGSSPRPDKARWDRVRAMRLRPHMLLAASFEGSPLSTSQRRLIVRVTESRLLVPGLGIATLDCDDIEFHGHSAQNGAIWPFLIGPFVEASLRAFGSDRGRHRMLSRLLNSQDLEAEPMAWAHSAGATTSPDPYQTLQPVHSGRPPMPLGPLSFALNAAEHARVKKLLTDGLPSSPAAMSRAGARP